MNGHPLDEFYAAGSPEYALADAAARGDSGEVARLARAGADPNAPGREDMLPLLWALGAQNKVGVRALLSAGADPNRRNGPGPSPMALVTGARDPELLAILLAHGGDPNGPTVRGEPLIFQAIAQRKLDAVRMLAEHGADLNARGVGDDTPLLLAATLNQFPIVRYLLERGADWRLANPAGATLAYLVDDRRIDPQFRDAYEAQRWTRAFLESHGVRFPVAKPWERNGIGTGGATAAAAPGFAPPPEGPLPQ